MWENSCNFSDQSIETWMKNKGKLDGKWNTNPEELKDFLGI